MKFNIKIFCIFIIVAFFGFVKKSYAANIYVDQTLSANCTSGNYSTLNRTCSGTDGNAYTMIQAAINSMSSGDDIYMRGGTYNETHISLANSNDARHGKADDKNKLTSYLGEWAIIDGQYADPTYFRPAVIWGTGGAGISNWIFEKFEVTGGGDPMTLPGEGAGIYINDNPKNLEFRYLYVHDNYSSVSGPGKAGGISLNSPSNSIIEYCYIKGNGNPDAERVTSNAQIAVTSDYKYSSEIVPEDSMHGNVYRYNLIDGQGLAGYGVTGFCHKGFQRFTGYEYGETENSSDAFPNGSQYRSYGDKIHHNIIVNSTVGLRLDQDYAQAFNNIVWLRNGTSDPLIGIETSDGQPSTRRGAYYSCVYNNTINASESSEAIFFPIGAWGHDKGNSAGYHWDCATDGNVNPWAYGYASNNIIQNATHGYDSMFISAEMSGNLNCTDPAPVSLTNYYAPRNLFFGCENYGEKVMRFSNMDYTAGEMDATPVADITWKIDSGNLFQGSSGADQYKTQGSFALDGLHTITNGGIGGNHPYLSGVTIPSYVGATNPNDSDWVDGVMALAIISNLQNASSGDPTWIEGGDGTLGDTAPPNSPSGLSVD